MKALAIFGTRPEAIKLAPVIQELRRSPGAELTICVTAQHREMLDQVLDLFQITPDIDLDIMRDNQGLFDITATALVKLGDVLESTRPDLVIVQGDTTTAMTSALAAYYVRTPVAHVEAGLRTYDKYQPYPEEINRAIIDNIAELCFAPTEMARRNLLRAGVEEERIFVTGNTVIDALSYISGKLPKNEEGATGAGGDSGGRRLILVTGHRRESFGEGFENICHAILEIVERNKDIDVMYPVHLNPNVRESVTRLLGGVDRVQLMEPLAYLPFVQLMRKAYLILTDSGGVQEEAPTFKVPVLVMRNTTERPEGVEAGVARLVGIEQGAIVSATQLLLDDQAEYRRMSTGVNPYGDGKAAERIVRVILDSMGPGGK